MALQIANEVYLMVSQTEDGLYFNQTSKEEVLEFMNDGEKKTILDHIPKFYDGYFKEYGTFILKAEVIIPKVVTEVTKYTF